MGQWDFQPNLNSTESSLGDQMEYQNWEESELFGYPIKYIKATETEDNSIFNESTSREFISSNGYDLKYKKDDDSLYQGSEVFGGFGYTPSYSNVAYISVKYFKDLGFEPIEGDLIYDKTDDIIFEITKVDTETETQSSLRMNNRIFSRKLYLKQYSFSYKDSFDSNLEDELMSDEINLEELDKLNDSLRSDIDSEGVIDNTNVDEIFGDLG